MQSRFWLLAVWCSAGAKGKGLKYSAWGSGPGVLSNQFGGGGGGGGEGASI